MSETGDGHFFCVVMLPREDVELLFASQDADAPTPTYKGELVPITMASTVDFDNELRKADRAFVRDVKRRRAKHDKMKHDDWLHSLRRKAGGY